ncbi:uncharacterized protein with ParB-like and HNH nuclease domain [Mucilaginibacter gracilis]|uniref:Uncharacterized protein with ParB-like and HNH nuclease domain n=1 Tax=Mucilaginibacter gracilis TaxID=423350 RepID=A0A495J478_9SPHI|nr:DUF262 domain-containing protein [Mucilaginibacter gracilis]RKR82799.1 uncharacterized protein with ParB-like and HNH nuclease domain [Mucilaginibacter gracilis]
MSYQTALPIADVINDVHRKKYLLPAIQREFVWSTFQIERLFDSLMRDYPINSFLFWKVQKEHVKEYEFYEFLRDYHERNKRHNPKADVSGEEEIIAVLDGQQRLTSLYIGLKGSYAYKLPRKRYDNKQAYPQRKLYLNLLSPSEEPELQYSFLFLTQQEAESSDDSHFWFPVGEILNLKELHQVNQYLIDHVFFAGYDKEKANFANLALSKLNQIIHLKPTISYYLETSTELDKVLNIFIRINSGGTILSYSDLLLSIATAQWQYKDAREEITKFVDEINEIGGGFNFNKDFVLKTCLVLGDFSNIAFKVDNFNKSNMLKIENNWDEISKAIRLAVNLVSSFGFNRDTLTSNNVMVPIAYYLKTIGLPENYEVSTNYIKDRADLKKWLIFSLLKRVFGGQSDNVLRVVRKAIQEKPGGFPLNHIIDQFKGTNKTLLFTDEDIENLTWSKYGQSNTFAVLSLLYPSLDFRNKFHIDHIYPKSRMTERHLKKKGISKENIETYISYTDYIGNLQLLDAIPNIEKQNKDFDTWLAALYDEDEIRDFRKKHYLPNVDLSITNFIEVFNKREKLIVSYLKKLLQMETSSDVIQETIL